MLDFNIVPAFVQDLTSIFARKLAHGGLTLPLHAAGFIKLNSKDYIHVDSGAPWFASTEA
jgi:hypothetical protein